MVLGFYLPRQKLLGESVFARNNRREKKIEKSAGFYFAEKRRQNPGKDAGIVKMLGRDANPDGRGLRFYFAALYRFFIKREIGRLQKGSERIAFFGVSGS